MSTENELSDQEILALTQKLQEEESVKSPLVAAATSLDNLKDEYVQGSKIFLRKINHLQTQGWRYIRKVRGDGSCFYRALAVRFVERVRQQGKEGRQRAIARLAVLDFQIASFADPEIVADFSEPFVNLLKADILSEDQLLAAFNDPEQSNAAVVYFRLITSSQIRKDADEFFPYLFTYDEDSRIIDSETGLPSVVRFCEHFVEAIGRDADHIMVQALTKALDLSLSIAYLDQSKGIESGGHGVLGSTSVDMISFTGQQFDLGEALLLLRPGHYDILLYVRSASNG